jgi:N-acetylmuramoyl-L-alanine amidase
VIEPRSESRRGPIPPAAGTAAVLALVTVCTLVAAAATDAPPSRLEIAFDPYGTLRWEVGKTPVLLISPARGDGWITIANRFTGTSRTVAGIRAANPGLNQVRLDRRVAIPVELLRGDLRLAVVRRIFPLDLRTGEGWEHEVLDPFSDGVEESWEWLAVLFTGRASTADSLKRANPAVTETGLVRGLSVVIPESRLLKVFKDVPLSATPTPRPTRTARPATVLPTPTPVVPGTGTGPLTFGRDADGEYALYRLRHGEALYSAVVVRFTGQLLAKQVNETAAEIAQRSGIDDVTSIPIGYPIKIPADLLLPQYLPEGSARRAEWEAEQRELAGFLELVTATDLSGVHIILDAGHGGVDSGAVQGGIWEAPYAYDIMCRIKKNLEAHTKATVWLTTEDERIGCSTPDRSRLDQSRSRVILTRPKYEIRDAPLGVHLRYYLTNDIILNRIGDDVPRSKTVFLSIHADSLHPSVRGAMAYVPSRYLRPSEPYTVGRSDIKGFAEYKAHPTIRLGTNFKARVEASSRHMAGSIISSLERNEIKVHPNQPVRDRVLRGRRRAWVPAVLRYTAAGNAVLLEVCNLGNADDRELILQVEWRESVARAVVEGIAAAYDE